MRTHCALGVCAAVVLLAATPAQAVPGSKCVAMTPAELRARAEVVFDGVALEGPTATGAQRFRVTRFLKGRGPTVVRVQTGTIVRGDGSGVMSTLSLLVRRGERWRVYARGSTRKVLRSNLCDGSRRR